MENYLKSVFFNNRTLLQKRIWGSRGAGKAEDIGNGSSFLSDQAETDVIR